mgnify:CR=1 FL=1
MGQAQSIFMPSESEVVMARETSRQLAPHIHGEENLKIRVVDDSGENEEIVLPKNAVRFLLDLLSQMGQGNALTLIPIHAELTTQQAADLCNVSRPFLVSAIEKGELHFKKVGTHRRIKFKDLMDYKKSMDGKRSEALDQLASLSQELGI